MTIYEMLIIFDNWDNWDNFEKTVLETCDIWDTDYSSDNWEPEIMTIFVTWQLIVTLDSIRNSCDVFMHSSNSILGDSHFVMQLCPERASVFSMAMLRRQLDQWAEINFKDKICPQEIPRSAAGGTAPIFVLEILQLVKPGPTGMSLSGDISLKQTELQERGYLMIRRCFLYDSAERHCTTSFTPRWLDFCQNVQAN